MGFFDSSSESKADQTTQTGEGHATTGIGSDGGNAVVSINNSKGKPNVRITNEGVTGPELLDLTDRVFEFAEGVSGQVLAQSGRASDAVANVATTASGAETEAGRLIGKLSVPVLIALGLVLWLWRR